MRHFQTGKYKNTIDFTIKLKFLAISECVLKLFLTHGDIYIFILISIFELFHADFCFQSAVKNNGIGLSFEHWMSYHQ